MTTELAKILNVLETTLKQKKKKDKNQEVDEESSDSETEGILKRLQVSKAMANLSVRDC